MSCKSSRIYGKSNLLCIDVGNTSTSAGLFHNNRLIRACKVSIRPLTAANLISRLHLKLRPADVQGICICSVIPSLTGSIVRLLKHNYRTKILELTHKTRTSMRIAYKHPNEVGPDRIANALAARERFGAPILVVDYGTATTFDIVGSDGSYQGGVIAPGIGTAASSLAQYAARLPLVEIRKPRHIIGQTTTGCIRSGLFLSQVGLTKEIIRQLKLQIGSRHVKVVGTGGYISLFKGVFPFDAVDPWLTLRGLSLVWQQSCE